MTNDATEASAESAAGRFSAVDYVELSNLARIPSRNLRRSSGLPGVREAARKSRDLKYTDLLHHVNFQSLLMNFCQLRKNAAVGVDQITWHKIERDLDDRIADFERIEQADGEAKQYRYGYKDVFELLITLPAGRFHLHSMGQHFSNWKKMAPDRLGD